MFINFSHKQNERGKIPNQAKEANALMGLFLNLPNNCFFNYYFLKIKYTMVK